jgi:parallel beta-helix repeat protein
VTTNLYVASGDGISISAGNVTVDLNGFALTGGGGSSKGIHFSPSPGVSETNVTVRNGSLSGWGYGVVASTGSHNFVLEHLAVSDCANYGIGSVVCPIFARDCISDYNGTYGIYAYNGQITDCDASNNGNVGIYGINCTVRNCSAVNNGNRGIYIYPGTVSDCVVQSNYLSGIYIDAPGSEVIGNTCIGNNSSASPNDAGIYVNDANNRIENNHVKGSGNAGISVYSFSNYTNNIIVKNIVIGNGANNYLTPGNQAVGPLITTTGTITNSNPWANFSF